MAEVEVELVEEEQGWSPYLSMQDACRLDDLREPLHKGDTATAIKHAKVYRLTPVAV